MLTRLSNSEKKVLKAVAEGSSIKQTAFQLQMPFKTVVSHRTRLTKKLGLRHTAHLVRLAMSTGIVSADATIFKEPDLPSEHSKFQKRF
jgi:DNA-binding NarL/FixJ family response regulator